MMEYLAHSAKEDCPPQSYGAHVKGVFLRAVKYAGEAENYALKCRGQLEDVARRSAILQLACKKAVKGGDSLSEDEIHDLVSRMIDQHVTPTCPHGRPLVVSISHRELDKRFHRIQ